MQRLRMASERKRTQKFEVPLNENNKRFKKDVSVSHASEYF